MHDQPTLQRLAQQQQMGGGGSVPKESESDKKKRKEQEKREEELFKLQKQQIAQSQAEAERARKVQMEQNEKIKNQENYESMVARADKNYRDFFNPFDPNTNYGKSAVTAREVQSAKAGFQQSEKERIASEKEAEAEAERLRIERMVPPVPTESGAAAQEASQEVRRREKHRRGVASTILAGETGGYNTEATTLLG